VQRSRGEWKSKLKFENSLQPPAPPLDCGS